MIIYYIIMVFLNIAAAVMFRKSLNITFLSVIPVFIMVLMLFQANYFKNEKTEKGFSSNFTPADTYTHEEGETLLQYAARALFIAIPWFIPFILFFPNLVKILSVFLYMISLALGGLIYRIKNKGALNNRVNAEKEELKKQKQSEELGKWK